MEGSRLIASGAGPIGCCDHTTIAWESTDGRRWQPHELPEALDGERLTGFHAKAGRVAVGDWITMADCKDGPPPCRPVTPVSDDPAVFGPARMEQVWKRPDGYVAVRYLLDDQEQPAAPMLWPSANGRRCI